VTIVNYKFIIRFLLKARIRTIITLLQITGINTNRYTTSKYIVTSLYFPGKDKSGNKIITETAPKEVYIIDNLKVNIFINIDVMALKGINILVSR